MRACVPYCECVSFRVSVCGRCGACRRVRVSALLESVQLLEIHLLDAKDVRALPWDQLQPLFKQWHMQADCLVSQTQSIAKQKELVALAEIVAS